MNKKVITQLMTSYSDHGGIQHYKGEGLPSVDVLAALIGKIMDVLFPGYTIAIPATHRELENRIALRCEEIEKIGKKQVFNAIYWERHQLVPKKELKRFAQSIMKDFIVHLPSLRISLLEDAQAMFEMDPAAKSLAEIMLAYPGFRAISMYRIAHFFESHNVPLIPRMITELAHSQTGIDIHPSATIGDRFCIDHGTGVVIGETAIIGKNVKLYQGVTIGALRVDKDDNVEKRHPTIEDHVTIYARTTILGGDTVIGKHSVIGGNLWIIKSVAEYSKLYRVPEKPMRMA